MISETWMRDWRHTSKCDRNSFAYWALLVGVGINSRERTDLDIKPEAAYRYMCDTPGHVREYIIARPIFFFTSGRRWVEKPLPHSFEMARPCLAPDFIKWSSRNREGKKEGEGRNKEKKGDNIRTFHETCTPI